MGVAKEANLKSLRDDFYYFPISNQVMGFISIFNQSSDKRALINVKLFILDFRVNHILERFYEGSNELFSMSPHFVLNSVSHRLPLSLIEQLNIADEDSEDRRFDKVFSLVPRLKRLIEDTRNAFPSTNAVADYLFNEEQLIQPEYFVLLILSGRVQEALEELFMKIREMEIRESRVKEWKDFKSRFDSWLINGAAIPSSEEGRKAFFESVGRRDLV